MTICPSCKSQNSEARNFCGGCGAPLMRFCPLCGFRNSSHDRFCGGCGSSLSDSAGRGAPVEGFERLIEPAQALQPEESSSDLPSGGVDELLKIARESAGGAVEEAADAKVSQEDIDSLFGA